MGVGRTQDMRVGLLGQVYVIDVVAASGEQSWILFTSDALSDSKLTQGYFLYVLT